MPNPPANPGAPPSASAGTLTLLALLSQRWYTQFTCFALANPGAPPVGQRWYSVYSVYSLYLASAGTLSLLALLSTKVHAALRARQKSKGKKKRKNPDKKKAQKRTLLYEHASMTASAVALLQHVNDTCCTSTRK